MAEFRLQSVLDYRKSLEDQAQQRLAQALLAEQQLQAALQQITAEMTRLSEQRRTREQQGMTVAELQLFQTRIDHQSQCLATARQQLEQAREVTAECQRHLLKASQDREAMERLKEKDALRHQQEQRRAETKELDEVGSRGRSS